MEAMIQTLAVPFVYFILAVMTVIVLYGLASSNAVPNCLASTRRNVGVIRAPYSYVRQTTFVHNADLV